MSYLIKNITLHSLLIDNSLCFYCNSKCESSTSSTIFDCVTEFTCKNCSEQYKISEDYFGKIEGFTFTCNDLVISIYYETENFSISKRDKEPYIHLTSGWINGLNNINFDFTNKDKLYNKIKTYVIMA